MNNDKEKRLDDLLDSALAQYGAAEPLHGLEDRVLGGMEEARLHRVGARRAWWMWGGVAAAVAAAIVVTVLLARPAEQKPGTAARTQSVPQQTAAKQPAVVAGPTKSTGAKLNAVATAKNLATTVQRTPKVRPEVSANALPRRDVFPTPMPPTEQELLLARYVRVTPHAEVLAQANRKPLEFHDDPLSAPADGGGGASPQKAQGTK
jgi:hypothetical protein